MMKLPNWEEIKEALSFKTFIIITVLILLSVLFFVLDILLDDKDQYGVLSSMSSTLGVSAITSFICELFLRLDIIRYTLTQIKSEFPNLDSTDTGVLSFFSRRDTLNFTDIWDKSYKYICIMGISSNDILSAAITPQILEKIKNEPYFKIQILLLNPWGYISQVRSNSEAYKNNKQCSNRIIETIKEVQNMVSLYPNSIELLVYNDIPSVSLILNESVAYVTPLTTVNTGGSSPYFCAKNLGNQRGVYKDYYRHFMWCWKNSDKVSNNLSELYNNTKTHEENTVNAMLDSYQKWINEIMS